MKEKQQNSWFQEGTCFICSKPCETDALAHYECCQAMYQEIKKKRANAPQKRVWGDSGGDHAN